MQDCSQIEEDSKTCTICMASFSFFGASKCICEFCFKAVCQKCSMQKAVHPETKTMKRICDTCYSEMIKGMVINQYKFEQERLKSEIFNFQKRMEIEKLACEKELKIIEDLNLSIDDTKNEIIHREKVKDSELVTLKKDIEKIDSDYQDISSRLQLLSLKNLELDDKVSNSEEQNKEFLTGDVSGIKENLNKLKIEIDELSSKVKEQKKTQKSEHFDMNINRIKDEINCLRIQKNRYSERIKELKSFDAIKQSNISLLLSNLSNASTSPEVGLVRGGIEDEEIYRAQETEIIKLRTKVERIQRKNVIDSQKCVCTIY